MRGAVLFVAACVLLLAGCGDDNSKDSEETKLTGKLVYARSGGIAGFIDEVTLRPGGRATFVTRFVDTRTVTLTPTELADVESALAAADLSTLDAEYVPPEPIPDGFAESVSYRGEKVSAAAEGHAPEKLVHLFGTLSTLVERYAKH